MESSIWFVDWLRRESVEAACVAERGVVLRGIGGELFIVSRPSALRLRKTHAPPSGTSHANSGKWISRTNISCAEVSSIIDSCGVGASLLAKGDAEIDEARSLMKMRFNYGVRMLAPINSISKLMESKVKGWTQLNGMDTGSSGVRSGCCSKWMMFKCLSQP